MASARRIRCSKNWPGSARAWVAMWVSRSCTSTSMATWPWLASVSPVRPNTGAAATGVFGAIPPVGLRERLYGWRPEVQGLLARIHRRTALGTALEEAGGCSAESGIMVLEQKTARKQGARNRCCHRPARLIDVDHQEAAPGDSKPLGHRESRPAGCAIFHLQCLPSILKYWSGRVRPPG